MSAARCVLSPGLGGASSHPAVAAGCGEPHAGSGLCARRNRIRGGRCGHSPWLAALRSAAPSDQFNQCWLAGKVEVAETEAQPRGVGGTARCPPSPPHSTWGWGRLAAPQPVLGGTGWCQHRSLLGARRAPHAGTGVTSAPPASPTPASPPGQPGRGPCCPPQLQPLCRAGHGGPAAGAATCRLSPRPPLPSASRAAPQHGMGGRPVSPESPYPPGPRPQESRLPRGAGDRAGVWATTAGRRHPAPAPQHLSAVPGPRQLG